MVSTVTGQRVDDSNLGPDYWWQNVRQPVRFSDAVNAAYDMGCRIFVEIGPRAILKAYVLESLADNSSRCVAIASLDRHDPEGVDPVSASFARALVHGAAIDEIEVFGMKLFGSMR